MYDLGSSVYLTTIEERLIWSVTHTHRTCPQVYDHIYVHYECRLQIQVELIRPLSAGRSLKKDRSVQSCFFGIEHLASCCSRSRFVSHSRGLQALCSSEVILIMAVREDSLPTFDLGPAVMCLYVFIFTSHMASHRALYSACFFFHSPFSHLAKLHNTDVKFHSYADDMQFNLCPAPRTKSA